MVVYAHVGPLSYGTWLLPSCFTRKEKASKPHLAKEN